MSRPVAVIVKDCPDASAVAVPGCDGLPMSCDDHGLGRPGVWAAPVVTAYASHTAANPTLYTTTPHPRLTRISLLAHQRRSQGTGCLYWQAACRFRIKTRWTTGTGVFCGKTAETAQAELVARMSSTTTPMGSA